jgi:hypothetical protein
MCTIHQQSGNLLGNSGAACLPCHESIQSQQRHCISHHSLESIREESCVVLVG